MGRTHDLILGVDLDNVVANYTDGLRRVTAMERGVDPSTLKTPTDWSYESWGLDHDQFLEMHRLAVTKYRMMGWLDPIPGASKVLNRLSDDGVRIRIVSHRLYISGAHAIVGADTLHWLEDHDIPYWDLVLVARKADVDVDLMIDDAPHNLTAIVDAAAERGHPNPTDAVVCMDWPYNRHLTDLPRARDWGEAEQLVRTLLLDR